MLQRQIMFKQLQELQRRQQLQHLGNNTINQSYANGMSGQDSSRMFALGNMQMMQQQGGPNGLFRSQNHNHGMGSAGLSQPQFDTSNLNQYPHLQGPSNLSFNLLSKNFSPFGSSFMSPQCNLSSNQISTPDGSFLSDQEKNFFGQAPSEGCNDSGMFSEKSPNLGLPQVSTSLDPLEQKILYSTDDNSFGSMVHHMDALPSIQSGSWSALMQSAVAETSSSDNGIQEEWSGLSFQNPETLSDNHNEKIQNNWVDRNLQNALSPSSKPENSFQNINMNFSFSNFHSPEKTIQLADYNSQQKVPAGGGQQIQTSLASQNIWSGQQKEQWSDDAHQPTILPCTNSNQPNNNFSGDELRGAFWLQGDSADNVPPGVFRKPCDRVNQNVDQLNIQGYSTETENMTPGENVEAVSTFVTPLDRNGENVTAPSESMLDLLNNEDTSNEQTPAMQLNSKASIPNELSPVSPDFGSRLAPSDPRTPQSYAFLPSLSMGTSIATTPSGHNVNDYIKNQHAGFAHMPSDVAHMPAQNELSSPKPYTFPLNLFRSSDSAPGITKTTSGSPNEHQSENSLPGGCSNTQQQPLNQSLSQNHSLVQKDGAKSDLFAVFQNNTPHRPIGGNEASTMTYQSQISLQMAPSWFKHYGTYKNGQMLPMYDPKGAVNAGPPLSETTVGNLQDNSLANVSQKSSLCPSTATTSLECKQLNPPCILPSDAACPELAVSVSKKRKLVELDIVPWHKEVSHGQSRLQDISAAELAWAQALSRRREKVQNEGEIVEGLLPVVRAKRRLIWTTQLMQQVFRPIPAVILRSDASSNCNSVAYFAARLALGDACNSTGQLSSGTNDESPDKVRTSKRTNGCKFSKLVEGFINQVKKLEDDLTRLDKSLSFVDVKFEAQELEKFSTINRFAKLLIKAHSSTVDHASSSRTSTSHRSIPARYVVAVPLPRILPEGRECLSL